MKTRTVAVFLIALLATGVLAFAQPAFVTPSPLPPAVAGLPYSAAISATGGSTPYFWDIVSSAGLPDGMLFAGGTPSATVSGTSTTPGTYIFTVSLRGTGDESPVLKSYSLTVLPPFAISTTVLANGYLGLPYTQSLVTENGDPPYVWSLPDGLPPPGVSLGASTGMLTGTPTEVGTFYFTVRAMEKGGQSATRSYSLTITSPQLTITSDSLPPARVGTAYSAQIATVGGTPPNKFRIDSGLPPGLMLDPSSGIVSGTPTQGGNFTLAVYAQDFNGFQTAKAVTLTVNSQGGGLQITTRALPNAVVGVSYSTQLAAANGTGGYTWSGCDKIPGLALNRFGAISGTPTTAGSYVCNVVVLDSQQNSAQASLPLLVATGVTVSLPVELGDAAVGVPYSQSFTAAGGAPPLTWTASGLPAGLAMSSTGVLSGTPTADGVFAVVVKVSDATGQQGDKTYSLTVRKQLAITTSTTAPAYAGVSYTQPLAAEGGQPPYTWSGRPAGGLSVSEDGKITGTPSAAGALNIVVTVADSANHTAVKTLAVNVATPLSITTEALPDGTVGAAYSQALAVSGGRAPFAFSVSDGALPGGITLGSAGALSGTPSEKGISSFSVRVTDANQTTATRTYRLTIGAPRIPTLGITSSATQPGPNQQSNIGVALSAPYQGNLTGRLALAFTSDTVNGADDASVQFASGGRTAGFSIPAGSAQASFTIPVQAVQFGSTAGAITITLDQLMAGGQDVTPSPAPFVTIQISRGGPVIRSVTAVRRANGFDVTVVGYATSREVTQAVFRFTPAAGKQLDKADYTAAVGSVFAAWYNSTQSAPFGSLFTLVMPFNTNGPSDAIAAVSVTLVNAAGSSQTVPANLQ